MISNISRLLGVFLLIVFMAGCGSQNDVSDSPNQADNHPKEVFTPQGFPDPPASVSWVTKARGFVFCTGMLGIDLSTFTLVNDSFENEVTQLMNNLRAMLESAGASVDDLVQVTVYLTDIELYSEFNKVYVRLTWRKLSNRREPLSWFLNYLVAPALKSPALRLRTEENQSSFILHLTSNTQGV